MTTSIRVVWRGSVCAAALLLAGCAQQMIRDDAATQVRSGQYEAAIQTLQDGSRRYPDSGLLRSGLISTREEATARLVAQATQERMNGQWEAANATLERARKLDPNNTRVQDLQADLVRERHVQQALQTARQQAGGGQRDAALRTLDSALGHAPRHPEVTSLKRQLELEQRVAAAPANRLELAETRTISLDMRNAPLASLLEALRDGSGVNFVVDRDVQMEQRASIFIRSARVEDAIDLVLGAFQLSRHIVDGKTVMVYPNTPEKHKQHREQVIRVFHLANAQAKTTATLLQNMLRIQPPFVDEKANMIALREPPEIVALAERLVALHDQGEAEVMLEVEVLEVKTSRLTELGINVPNAISFSPLPLPGQSGLTLDSFNSINSGRVGVSVGNVLLNLRREVGDFNTLANPRIRSRSREKATILIGDKIPVITTTAGSNGFVSENISYQDVGLKLEVEPVVSPDDEVSIKLGLEVSSLAGEVRTTGGSVAFQIGTRNANTTLRLRDGETQLLGGLISKDDRSSSNRVPGLGDLPVAGRLFSSQKDDVQKTELVLAITPRILRSAARPDVSQAEMWVGTENFTRLRPRPGARGTQPAAGSDAMPPTPDARVGAPGAAAAAASSAANPAAAQPPLPTGLTLQLKGPETVKAGETFTVAVHAASGIPLAGLPMDLRFAPDKLQVVGVSEGAYFRQSPAASSFTHAVNATEGRISVGLLSNAEKGVAGEGDLVLLRLKALAPGKAELWFQNLDPLGVNGIVPLPSKPTWSTTVQ
ncbi:cohesin domain-containing protein [Hydrogenophaga sp.]|uniref:cohesin domain-containing protein n=1 Tax=Hydrogenophaga sp. TaxID=1904254 RepID=UPI00286D8D8A|nr:cohesin domain-containing protein [Hydrogenophaga sp.]